MIDSFLGSVGWGGATRTSLAGDASSRRYTRLSDGSRRAILMEDTDPENLARFRRIGAHLRGLGLSAPSEFAVDESTGLLLLEDLGDTTLSRLLVDDHETARSAFEATAAMLPSLSAPPPAGLDAPDAAGMAQMVALTFDLLPESETLRNNLLPKLAEALATYAPGPPTLSLRDVHADNLIWLPDRTGDARVGLLDYQDAMLLPHGYDLASLLDDPRREVPKSWRESLVENWQRHAVLSLQRNLRILGIFHRLATQFGKPQYRTFLPRTRVLLTQAAEDLPSLRAPVDELLTRTEHWEAT